MTRAVATIARCVPVAVFVAASGCGLVDQGAPPWSGPSSLALTVDLSATPDRLVQDGTSQSTITAVARDAGAQPLNGLLIAWHVAASDGTFVEPSSRTSVTDAAGRATVVVTAPPPPPAIPIRPVVLTVHATPASGNAANDIGRQVTVQLIAPLGTLPANQPPIPSFVISPATATIGQTVTVDASGTRDEGGICSDACTYAWDFGDGGTAGSRIATHVYTGGGTFTIRLIASDARGASAAATGTIAVAAPALTANISVSPVTPKSGVPVNFDAAGSTVGSGVRILDYAWIWGDGSPNAVTPLPQTQHTYTVPVSTTFVVRLTIHDNLGRTATTTASVTVAP